jgi:hypothetical protein
MGEAFKTACTRIEARPTGLSKNDQGANLLLPLPQLIHSAASREGVAAE